MSIRRGDLLSKTKKLVKGLAKKEPVWLKAMEQAPPPTFPRAEGKVQKISLPEDIYVQKFFKRHHESKYHDPIKISSFEHPPARIFGQRVLQLKEQGVNEQQAMAVADMEYRAERKARKKAYSQLKSVCRQLGKKPPPNPYPSAVKEIQAEEKILVRARFFNPEIRKIAEKLKEDRKAELLDLGRDENWINE